MTPIRLTRTPPPETKTETVDVSGGADSCGYWRERTNAETLLLSSQGVVTNKRLCLNSPSQRKMKNWLSSDAVKCIRRTFESGVPHRESDREREWLRQSLREWLSNAEGPRTDIDTEYPQHVTHPFDDHSSSNRPSLLSLSLSVPHHPRPVYSLNPSGRETTLTLRRV